MRRLLIGGVGGAAAWEATRAYAADGKLSTEDIKAAQNRLFDADGDGKITAKDFERFFEWKRQLADSLPSSETTDAITNSSLYKSATGAIAAQFDADGDGKITPKDFEILFNRQQAFLDRNASQIDKVLPFAGQIVFGIFVGYCVGCFARGLARHKLKIMLLGAAGYSGCQYYAQLNDMSMQVMKAQVQQQVVSMADQNQDGKVTFADLNKALEGRMDIVDRKLGPGGFAPGAVGTGTFLFGLWRGARA